MDAPTQMPDARIVRFIRRHHVLTLATAQASVEVQAQVKAEVPTEAQGIKAAAQDEPGIKTQAGTPYCANAFYCYDAERNLFVFSSDDKTRHAQQMRHNPRVAASIVLETRIVGRLQGLQLCGTAQRADMAAHKAYIRRFPFAALAELTLWVIKPDYMKYTDNTLGFGTKLIWNA